LTAGTDPGRARIGWADEAVGFEIDVAEDGTARLARLVAGRRRPPDAGADGQAAGAGGPALTGPAPAGPGVSGAADAPAPEPRAALTLPLADIVVAGAGRSWSGSRYTESVVGRRLRYLDHDEGTAGPWHQVRVDLGDPVSGLRAEVSYQFLRGHGVLRSWVHLTNGGTAPVTVQSVTSFLAGGLPGPDGDAPVADLDLLWARSDWLAEGRARRCATCCPT
jgi:hypothetical protein